MRFPRGFADEVRNQADIVRIVSDYVSLKKRGQNYIACCPFHSEKTPSFNVHQGKGIFKCFGCNAGGTVFDFIMRIEGCSFPEALRIVADKSGIPIPAVEVSEDYEKSQRERDTIYQLNEMAAQFFEAQLEEEGGERARQYVAEREIDEATRRLFRIGYAPDRWDGLLNHLTDQGATPEEIVAAGLAVLNDQGKVYDRFRGRLMFPICDSQGRVIAFGGRVLGEGEPKYLNSPETAVYTKGKQLYGLSHTKDEIRRAGYVILVEGYLDCIIPYQAGVRNLVASLGTALTDRQVRLLRRYMDKPQIIVNFDADAAGQAATMRSIEMLLAEGFKVNILRIPDGKDPDEYVRRHGEAAFRALFKQTQPYIEYIIQTALAEHDTTKPSGKVAAVNAILPHLAKMRDKVARLDWAAQIADRLKVDDRIFREEMKRVAVNRQGTLDQKRIRPEEMLIAERQLLELLLHSAEVRRAILPNLQPDDYADLATESLFAALVEDEAAGRAPDISDLTQRVETEAERDILPGLWISDLAWAGGDDFETLFKRATEAMRSLRRRALDRRLDAIQLELQEAERMQDGERIFRLYQEKADLKRRKLALTAA